MSAGADERPIARRLEEILERVNSGELELSRLEGDLDALEQRLGAAALDEVAEAPPPVLPASPFLAATGSAASPPESSHAPVAARHGAPAAPFAASDAAVEALSRQVDGLRRHLEHVRALGANTDRKLEALAVAVLESNHASARSDRRERVRAAIVAACVLVTILLSLLAEHAPV